MIILNIIDGKLFVELGTKAFKIISLRTFFNNFYSILYINWHKEQWAMFCSQQIELNRARYNHSPNLKYQNCWLRTQLLRRKSVIQCILKELIEHCTFHKITATIAILFCLRNSMFFCEIVGQKVLNGKAKNFKRLNFCN